MYRRYYGFPVKQKSDKTKEIIKNSENYKHVKQLSEIEKLDYKQLKFQKDLFQKDLNLILSEYSLDNYKKKINELFQSIKIINESFKELLKLYKKNKNNFKIKSRFFQEDAIMFPSKVELQELTIDSKKLDHLLNEENKILTKIKDENIENKRLYFVNLLEIIKFYYLYYKIEIFSDNKKAFSYHLSYSSKIKDDFDYNPQVFITDGVSHFDGLEFDNAKEAIAGLNVPNLSLKLSDCVEMDNLGNSKRKIIQINTTKYNKLSKNNGLEDYLNEHVKHIFDPKKIIIDKDVLNKFNLKTKIIIENILRKIELTSRKQIKQKEKSENFGFVYVLKSVGYPGMYKIGSTYGLAEERAEELSGTNVPDPWTVAAKIKIQNALYYEKQIHKILAQYRYRKGREFFNLDLKKIKKCLDTIYIISNKGKNNLKFNDIKKKLKIIEI